MVILAPGTIPFERMVPSAFLLRQSNFNERYFRRHEQYGNGMVYCMVRQKRREVGIRQASASRCSFVLAASTMPLAPSGCLTRQRENERVMVKEATCLGGESHSPWHPVSCFECPQKPCHARILSPL